MALPGSGNDLFVWSPGDGADVAEGGDGQDAVQMNGSGGTDSFVAVANGTRVAMQLDGGPGFLDIGTVETVPVALGHGTDLLTGRSGHDVVDGNQGDDIARLGAGSDFLIGGAGNDIIAMAGAVGSDVVRDFLNGSDNLQLSGYGAALNGFDDLAGDIFQAGIPVIIDLGANVAGAGTIELEATSLADIDASDFLFA